jgi:hypothetical protein
MIESQGERAGDVLKEFVAVNQSEEDIETRALWADVMVAVRNLTSDAVPPRTVSSKGRVSANSGP